ncbi:fumarylacetoacetate hydrolase family protein [Sulfurisoma sediminicola]|uniref:2-keto-4-pentenoate hydratase/2-oxohepta-3-ene-1,7-dioic acid hydratase in catechol pathway n=1 Tax=Sulfurisoma sediminicola TaxID=1381557 RepID=A0A497XEU5_9PROT|nr:fumarylacetoacetate hydrolase family protein [Sulfurisoma sediminicola]RLJ64697.1 2-keto-4-pentenoate hydratase/2-oxohepta-3-ene-1,7-dioic acid hydratase in catechol pathway [Sulfurisoma sediminicola]
MSHWLRCEHAGRALFGELVGDRVRVHAGELFGAKAPTGEELPLAEVRLLTPCQPGKLLGLWNNFHERAAVEKLTRPAHPLYFVKTDNCYLAGDQDIRRPTGYDGPVVFEGELGVVIGSECRNVAEDEAERHIFGYTCVNDVTARAVLKSDPSFPQWVRAKSFDTFGVFGPVIATSIAVDGLRVRTAVDGVEKQNYPVADMFFSPRQIVSRISQDMTLRPGDIIACGTSVGTDAMAAGCSVEVRIDGIGALRSRFI